MPFPLSSTLYCTLAEARSVGVTGDDPTVTALVGDASRIVDAYCWTTFDPAPTQAITGVVVAGTAATVTVASTAALGAGQPVFISGVQGFTANAPAGGYAVAAVVDGTHFTINLAVPPTGAYTSGGMVTVQQTVMVSDVRRPIVKLPTPFANITSVTLNGGLIDSSNYILEEWGIRLYSLNPFNNGWPIRGSGDAGTWPAQASGGPFGSQVMVTATFGFASVPRQVAIAARMLCRKLQNTDGPYERGQTRLQVGNFDVNFNPADPHPLDSTGDAYVDQLLQPFKRSTALVA